MSDLKIVSLLLGAVFLIAGAVAFIRPQAVRSLLKAFPRNKAAGWVLTAICIAWAGWLVYKMPLGGFERYKNLVYLLIPVSFFMIITYMGELLAARALGGFLMLVPYPMLLAAQFHPSEFRYVIIIMAYAMVIKGMLLTLSPYLFRRFMNPVCNNDNTLKFVSGVWVVFGIILLALGLIEF